MPAVRGEFQPRVGRQRQRMELGDRDHRIVLRHQDVGRHLQRRQAFAGDRVAVEIGVEASRNRCAAAPAIRSARACAGASVRSSKSCCCGNSARLRCSELAPLVLEIAQVHAPAALHLQHRHAPDRAPGRPPRRVPAAARPRARATPAATRSCRRANSPPPPAAAAVAGSSVRAMSHAACTTSSMRLEWNSASLRWWVSPWSRKLSRNTSKPRCSSVRRGQAHVARFGAAFPAVQQQRQPARLAPGHRAVQALQAHAIAAIDDVRGGARRRWRRARARRGGGAAGWSQHRLQVRVAQPPRRVVVAGVGSRRQRRATVRLDRRATASLVRIGRDAICGGQLAIAATMRSRAQFGDAAAAVGIAGDDRLEEMHFRPPRRLAQQAQEVAEEMFARLERDRGSAHRRARHSAARPVAPARRLRPRPGRCAHGTGRSRGRRACGLRGTRRPNGPRAAARASRAARRPAIRCCRADGRWFRRAWPSSRPAASARSRAWRRSPSCAGCAASRCRPS